MARTPSVVGVKSLLLVACLAWSPTADSYPSTSFSADIKPGDVLVADLGSGAVHHYDAAGSYLGEFASGLSQPADITVDRGGNIYVSAGDRVNKFSPSGVLLLSIQLTYRPGNIEIGRDGTIYVADYFAGNVYRFSDSGTALGLFAATGMARADFMAFDASGNLYVTDFGSGSIRRISPTGADLGNFVTGLVGVEGIVFDSSGNLYAALSGYGAPSQSANIVQKISPTGEDLGVFASFPFAPIRAAGGAYGLAFDSAGNLYVANFDGDSVEWFSPSGVDLGVFAFTGLAGPRDLVVVPGPTTEDHCKNGGWQTFAFPRVFRNQGDCLRFVR